MVSAPKVVEDAGEAPGREMDRPPWGWLAAGLLVGAGLAVLLLRVDTSTPSTETTVAGSPSSDSSPGGIGGEVEGFPDGLVAATRSDGQSLELLIWPLTGELYERAIPVGASSPPDPVAFDISGRRMATLLPVPGKPFGVLYAGAPENAAIIALDVTGYAWHDSAPSALAYTTFESGELFLWVTRGNLAESELVAQAVGIEGHVAAWGDWGFAIQDEVGDSIVLFTDHGEIKDFHNGRVLDSEAAGWIAIENEGLGLLSAGGGVRGIDNQEIEGNLLSARFSPNGSLLAVLTIDGISVVSLDGGLEVTHSGERPGVPQIVWSSDNRFVLYPGLRGIIVIDTHIGVVRELLDARTFTGLGVVPLDES